MARQIRDNRSDRLRIVSSNLLALRESKFPGRGGSKKCAEALGIKQQQWSPWEKGLRIPTTTSLKKIAHLFNVPVKYLETEHSSNTSQNVPDPGLCDEPLRLHEAEKAGVAPNRMSHDLGIVHAITQNIGSQLASRLNNMKATFKLEISVVDVELSV